MLFYNLKFMYYKYYMNELEKCDLVDQGFIKPALYYSDKYYVTKQFVINVLFFNVSIQIQQKILKRVKKINLWNNDIFEPFKGEFYTCDKNCTHEYGYCNSINYTQEVLRIKIENIPNDMKIKDIDNDCYWINLNAFTPLIELFTTKIPWLYKHCYQNTMAKSTLIYDQLTSQWKIKNIL